MDHFSFKDGVLHAEDVPLSAIADAVGTPVYVYSAATFRRHARVFREALSALTRAPEALRLAACARPMVALMSEPESRISAATSLKINPAMLVFPRLAAAARNSPSQRKSVPVPITLPASCTALI